MLLMEAGATVQNQNNIQTGITPPTEPIEPTGRPWQAEVGQLLSQAAALCIDHGVDVDAFMSGAWASYVEARPGLRDHLEEIHLRSQLEELRKAGRLGSA
jgi:hypothetical protein